MNLTWPVGFWNWLDFLSIIFFALFCLDKARLMYIRSRYRDQLGWALIVTDIAVGVAFLFGIVIALDPPRFFNSAEHKIERVIVLLVIAWTWIVMRRTKPARMNTAVGGDA